MRLRSPKLEPQAGDGRPTPGSRYYAGYSVGFVEDLLAQLNLPQRGVILDPWNGAGTTTTVASTLGYRAVGIDINPVLVVVAKARQLRSGVAESVKALAGDILAKARAMKVEPIEDDPLEQWFTAGTSAYLRNIERATWKLLVNGAEPESVADPNELSALAASFYVVLFESVRSFLGSFTTSNPTWIKKRKRGEAGLSLSKDAIDARYRSRQRALHSHLVALSELPDGLSEISLGSSTALTLEDDTVDAVVASPPYCTRIDYAVLTRPELAVMGVGSGQPLGDLRRSMIGGPTMVPNSGTFSGSWGPTATAFLTTVEAHESKASSGYYLRYFLQYFDAMADSLQEIRRVLRPTGSCALVVQDSYYKEVHNDLPSIIEEMAELSGFASTERIDFTVDRTMAGMHPGARKYRTSFAATESLILVS